MEHHLCSILLEAIPTLEKLPASAASKPHWLSVLSVVTEGQISHYYPNLCTICLSPPKALCYSFVCVFRIHIQAIVLQVYLEQHYTEIMTLGKYIPQAIPKRPWRCYFRFHSSCFFSLHKTQFSACIDPLCPACNGKTLQDSTFPAPPKWSWNKTCLTYRKLAHLAAILLPGYAISHSA